jgi:hypothetical protein
MRGKTMEKRLRAAMLCILLSTPAFAAKGPEVDMVDNKLSVNAETVPLGRLIRLVDMATGMKSKVPPDLANRNISVQFSNLNLNDGVRKIFQGQPVDYVVVEGQGIIITAASQNITGSESVPVYNSGPNQPFEQGQPFVQDFQNPIGQPQPAPNGIPGQAVIAGTQQQQQQPPTIQTPFGPIANPRAQQQQPNSTFSTPGQSMFSNPFGAQQQQQQQQPGVQQANPSPFGQASPFGTPAQPQQNAPNNNPFNSAPLFGQQPQQPRNP